MRYKYDGTNYDVLLIDDGTPDTVLSVNGISLRFDSEYARTEDGSIQEYAITDAIENCLDSMEGKI